MELVAKKRADITDETKKGSDSLNWSHGIKGNEKSLSDIVSLLAKVKKRNVMNDKQFESLSTLLLSRYVEREVENTLSKSINDITHSFLRTF